MTTTGQPGERRDVLERIYLNAWGRIAKPSNRKLRERYAACCTDVIITINGARHKQWTTFRSVSDYAECFAHFRELGVRVHVMTWIRPDIDGWIRPMVAWLRSLRMRAPFESVLLDAEGQWSRGWPGRKPRPRKKRDLAWASAAAQAHVMLSAAKFRVGVTDVPMVDWDVVKELFRHADYAMPQAHEFAGHPKRIRRAGRLINWTFDRWRPRLRVCCELIPHLAFYGVQTQKSVRCSVETAVGRGAVAVAGWTGRSFGSRASRKVLAEYKRQIVAEGCA